MSSFRTVSSYGTSTNAQGQLSCYTNVATPAKVLTEKEVTEHGVIGAAAGFTLGLLAGGGPAILTTPAGWFLGKSVAKETNEKAKEINKVRDSFARDAEADLAAAGCSASNTARAENSRWAPQAEKK